MSDAAKRTLRTVVQMLVGLCVLLPSAAGPSGLTAVLPWAAGAVAVAGALSRLMALPAVQALLPSWLRTDTPPNSDAALRALPDPPAPAAVPPGFGFTAGTGTGTDSGTGIGTDSGTGIGTGSDTGSTSGPGSGPGPAAEPERTDREAPGPDRRGPAPEGGGA